MSDSSRWNERYAKSDTPWETGQPSTELQRFLTEIAIRPCRALELGCGTGASSVWLAQLGFDVTALDISSSAIERARQRADAAGVRVRFLVADVLNPPPELAGPFDFFFDRGCYHVVRREDATAYLKTLRHLTASGTLGLVLAGNAREPHEPGPPAVREEQIRSELGSLFDIVQLREFRFDQVEAVGVRFLGWSCLLRRHSEAVQKTGKIVSIVHKPAGIDPRPPDHYARVPLQAANLEVGRGIVTDRKGSRPERQLNVMALESLETLRAEGYRTAPGEMGEQIVISGIAIDRLPAGRRLRLGAEVVIEVFKPRTGCDRLQRIQGCTPADVANRLGVMACVLAGGTIQVGDTVVLDDPEGDGFDRGE
jgi:MOSC domain-containing protein YiiM/predicted O-methyltransferase YrrM